MHAQTHTQMHIRTHAHTHVNLREFEKRHQIGNQKTCGNFLKTIA